MSYTIERYPAGPLDTNGYLLIDGDECLVIDPSLNSTTLLFDIKEHNLKPLAILLTHGHFDHFLGIDFLRMCRVSRRRQGDHVRDCESGENVYESSLWLRVRNDLS